MKYPTAFAATVLAVTLAAPVSAATTLRMGVGTAPLASETRALEHMAQLVAERSQGELTLQVIAAGKLGTSEAQIENLQLGTQDMHANVIDWFQKLEKDWAAMAMPFLFTGNDHIRKFQATDTYVRMKEQLRANHGLRIVADNWYRLPKILVTKRPVFAPSDLEGVKLRMPNLPTYTDTWAAFGAKPTVIAWKEAYLALKTGTVEGMDSPLSGVYPQKFYQAAPYVLMTNHLTAPYSVIISERAWGTLSGPQRELLVAAGKDAGVFYTRLISDSFSAQKTKMMAEGAVFIETGVQAFVDKASATMIRFEKDGRWSAGMVDQIRALARP